ncbi:uncharacterized protein [Lepeophtheirus salmonis]|uniref:uncharacterized protein n=1 Tax=Lepeophtheirus salmonis TaxID=72036 RepID=UPI001AE27EA0|nr:leucine-rich repeat neuronal protein 1-like [Lepeophtheirus salmonis]
MILKDIFYRIENMGSKLIFLLLPLLMKGVLAYCPESCICDNTNLFANCSFSEEHMNDVQPLDVIPIMLNPSIKRLIASRNRVRKLEGAIRVYRYLESLDLSQNELKTLGRAQFVESSRLQFLDLSNNFLTSLHKQSFEGLSALITLDLNENAISSLDDNYFEHTSSLVELRLKGNKISKFYKDAFAGLSRLRVLHLEENLLSELNREWFLPLENLRFLYLDKNQIQQLPSESLPLSALRMLSLKGNKLLNLSIGNPFKGLKSMDTLDLSNNFLEIVPNEVLREANKLRHLDISINPIHHFDVESFRSMFVLESLKANNMNRLKLIQSHTFMDNIKLQELYLNSNMKLLPIPLGLLQTNTRMKVLSLRNGTWSTLSPQQLPPSPLEALLLGGLPLYCNCSLTWLWDLYHRNKNSSNKIELDNIWCENLSGSPRLANVSVDSLACTDFTRILVAISVAIIVTVSILLLVVGIGCAYRVRTRRKNPHQCLYMKDETMIYKFSHPPQSSLQNHHDLEVEEEEEPYYEVPKYANIQDDDPKSSGSSSKYSSSGYVGSELWEPEYYATVKNGPKTSIGYGSPHNSGSSTGSSMGGANLINNNARNTGSLSSPLYFSPSRGHLIHHANPHPGATVIRNATGNSSPSKNPNRVNLYV